MNRRPSWFDLFRPLLVGIFCRPLLAAPVVVVFAVTLFGAGSFLGAPDLFWHENRLTQLLAGAGVGLLFVETALIGFLLDEGPKPRGWPLLLSANWLVRRTQNLLVWLYRLMGLVVPASAAPKGEAPNWRRLRWHLVVTWLPLLLVLAASTVVYLNLSEDWPPRLDAAAVADNGGPYVSKGWSLVVPVAGDVCLVLALGERWPLLAGLGVSLVLTGIFIRLFHGLRRRLPSLEFAALTGLAGGWREVWLHLLIAFPFVVLIVLPWTFLDTLARCFLIGVWAACHGVFVFLCRLPGSASPHRWKHLLAGAASLSFFLSYEVLFLLFWVGKHYRYYSLAEWISPALVLCLLLALLVAAHGFFKFHFGQRHLVVTVGLFLLAVAVNSLVLSRAPPTATFPDLDYGKIVRLEDVDFPTFLENVRSDEEDLRLGKETETGQELSEKDKDDLKKWIKEETALQCKSLLDRYDSQVEAEEGKGTIDPPPEWDQPGDSKKIGKWADGLRRNLRDREFRRLDAWKKAVSGTEDKKPKLVVVAVSGGASRSAYWTALVLDQLERTPELQPFPAHVRVITGASGGMVGASYWTATLPDDGTGHAAFDPRKMAQDSLTAVAQGVSFVDLPMLFVPVAHDYDRGRALQDTWAKLTPDLPDQSAGFAKPFRALAAGEWAGRRPSLIFTPDFVEDGKRLFISNLYLPFLTENTGHSLSKSALVRASEEGDSKPHPANAAPAAPKFSQVKRPPSKQPESPGSGSSPKCASDDEEDGAFRYSLPGWEFYRLFPYAKGFTLGTAARMSASFPYVSPAVKLPTSPSRRVVDAGYYDGYGVDVAAAWISHYRDWIRCNTSGVVLIQIRDSPGGRDLVPGEAGRGGVAQSFEWLTGPLEGAWAARDSVMCYRNDEQVQTLSRYFNHDRPGMFTTVIFECEKKFAMTWYLSERDQKQMLESAFPERSGVKGSPEPTVNEKSLADLVRWWNDEDLNTK